MSPTHTLAWLPESLCGRLAAELQSVLADWTTVWGLPAAGEILVQRVTGTEAAHPSEAIDLLAPPPPAWRGALAQTLFKAAASDSVIVDGVIRQLTEQLQDRLRERLAPETAPAPTTGLPGHWGVQVSVELAGRRCGLRLSVAQLRASNWLAWPPSRALDQVSLEQAFAAIPVPLVAELGRARLGVGDLLQLAPGDVLVLNETLDAPLRLVSPGSSLVLAAHLGATSDSSRRAARWSTPS